MTAFLHAIGCAVPPHDIHPAFLDWAGRRLADPRERALFGRMADRAGIARRWSVLPAATDPGGFYAEPQLPPTSARMQVYAEAAPALALAAVDELRGRADLHGITHLVVASCTGFTAPGLDQIVARRLGLPATVERTLVGFMGCYAAVAALRLARHLVRSEPGARVLVLTVELSTLHLQPEDRLEPLLAMLQFGDGAAAALVTGDPGGLALGRPFSLTLEDSHELIRWTIGDQGFAMHLSGEVPGRIAAALAEGPLRALVTAEPVDAWAVHAGGRSILDAVERALDLPADALDVSRAVLRDHGNMSSATLMFALAGLIDRPADSGIALAFGPGLAAEGLRFSRP